MHKILLAFMALSFHTPAHATQITVDDAVRSQILTLTLEQVFDKPVEGGPSTVRPIVSAPELTLPANITAFGVPLTLKSRDAAKSEQLAWFVYVSKVASGPDQASVAYQTPYNGKYGTVTLVKTDGQWAIQDHQRMHSSSGARFFYGELYEGTDCRDGSEMAQRWNTYKDALEAAMARRARTAEDALPSTCPGKEFPDVAAYKQFKAMGLNK
jgi:hypothetical protein